MYFNHILHIAERSTGKEENDIEHTVIAVAVGMWERKRLFHISTAHNRLYTKCCNNVGINELDTKMLLQKFVDLSKRKKT